MENKQNKSKGDNNKIEKLYQSINDLKANARAIGSNKGVDVDYIINMGGDTSSHKKESVVKKVGKAISNTGQKMKGMG